MYESTDRTPSPDERVVRYLTIGQTTIDATTDKIIERGITLNDLKPVIAHLNILIECAYQISMLALPIIKRAKTKPFNSSNIFGYFNNTVNLIDATYSFIECIEREVAIADRARTGVSPAEPQPEDGSSKAARGRALP